MSAIVNGMESSGLLYIEDFGELFVDVQKQKVFKDQKFFTDCTPKFSVDEILRNYGSEKGKKWFCAYTVLQKEFYISG